MKKDFLFSPESESGKNRSKKQGIASVLPPLV
jgi:hypothetical protein